MSDKNNTSSDVKVHIAELNNYQQRSGKRVNFSVESQNTKPYDINKMTGNTSQQSSNNNEE